LTYHVEPRLASPSKFFDLPEDNKNAAETTLRSFVQRLQEPLPLGLQVPAATVDKSR
jgi:hypothetical protein